METELYFHNGRFVNEADPKLITRDPSADFTVYYYQLDAEEMAFKTKYPEAPLDVVIAKQWPKLPKDIAKKRREWEYRTKSDKYYISYQKCLERGELDKAESEKENWLVQAQLIEEKYPYED